MSKKVLKRVASELLAGNPLWKIIVLKNSWLCPFCGEVGVENLRMDDSLEERMAYHLAACEAYADGAGAPLERGALEKRAAAITFDHRLRRSWRDPAFRVTDHEGCWICPYCAKPTAVALDALAVERGVEPEPRAAGLMVRHLLECADHAGGTGKPRLMAEIAQAATRADWKKRARRIRSKLETEEAWRFRDMDKCWLCPFCASATEIPFDRDHEVPQETCEAVLDHLDGCAAWRQLEGKPRTERYLKDRVIAINRARVLEKLKRKLATHAIWQVTDADDVWYCPYCAKATGVMLPEPQKAGVSEAALNEVWAHLSSCPAYAGKRAQLKSRSFLRNVVGQADRQIRLRREVRRAIAEDPRWTVHDDAGSWLCPHCKKVQKPISVSREAGLLEKTLEQVVTHLLEQCPHYAEGQEPSVSAEELISGIQDLKGGRRTKSGSADSEEWIQRIDQEVAALKTKVEVSVELERSLEDARSRQLRLLPRVPEVGGFEFGIVYKPCSTVGGDFYDFVKCGEDQLGIAIGDISGHGIEAALLVGLAKKLLEIHGRGRTSPAETLLLANADIYPDLDAKTFVTVFYGVLNTRTRELRFSRAGHNPLILFNPERTPRLEVLDSRGMALGMDAGPVFRESLEEVSIKLERGDLLFQFTDGVPESMNHDKDEFGLERLYAVIEQHGHAEAEYLLYQIEKALADFREGAKQKDDITMVAIKVL
ncbi:MAG TPA: PP2C family protein-serine/threonine phosphatase [Planctomycetota bacterium]|nr:PP2C family protein-serine/threonine phosphatase [Planctomycetota bacterium]